MESGGVYIGFGVNLVCDGLMFVEILVVVIDELYKLVGLVVVCLFFWVSLVWFDLSDFVYINSVVELVIGLDVELFLDIFQGIENVFGCVCEQCWVLCMLDFDIIDFRGQICCDEWL